MKFCGSGMVSRGSSRAAGLYDSQIRSVNLATGLSLALPVPDCALRCSPGDFRPQGPYLLLSWSGVGCGWPSPLWRWPAGVDPAGADRTVGLVRPTVRLMVGRPG